eukprot:5326479-Amphidinium_carterae.1
MPAMAASSGVRFYVCARNVGFRLLLNRAHRCRQAGSWICHRVQTTQGPPQHDIKSAYRRTPTNRQAPH